LALACQEELLQLPNQTRKLIQIVLSVSVMAAGLRLLLIYRSRYSGIPQPHRQEAPINPDYYVSPKKLYAYDLKSAAELSRQPVWVREGFKWAYYGYDPGTHHGDFRREAGLLGPLEKLQITAVELSQPVPIIKDNLRLSPNRRQVLAAFRKGGRDFAVPIGTEDGGDFHIYADEIFYLQDPHALYKHWPGEVWNAIEQHQVRPGMNEMQVLFALGMGVPQASASATKVVTYPNGGHALQVIYQDGRAVTIKSVS
jgi:hypothetical protein